MNLAQLDWVAIISRWAHILAAITAVGGTIFARAVVVPRIISCLEGTPGAPG